MFVRQLMVTLQVPRHISLTTTTIPIPMAAYHTACGISPHHTTDQMILLEHLSILTLHPVINVHDTFSGFITTLSYMEFTEWVLVLQSGSLAYLLFHPLSSLNRHIEELAIGISTLYTASSWR